MSTLFEPVNAGLAPNLQPEDALLALKLLCQPWRWQEGKAKDQLKSRLKSLWGRSASEVFLFASGREALWALFKALPCAPGDEVLLQAFTCVAVPNAVRWAGLKPVYVDIDPDTFNLDPQDLSQKISPRSRAVVIQHTFGIGANVEAIKKLALKHHLFVIEDCAHALGTKTKQGLAGKLGEAAVLSFGRDKSISGVWGGAVISHQPELSARLGHQNGGYPSRGWVGQQLLHPVLFWSLILPFNQIGLGKLILLAAQKLNLLSLPVGVREKQGNRPWPQPRRLPNALAALILSQLDRLEAFIRHRRHLGRLYEQKLKPVNEVKLPGWDLNDDVPLRVAVRLAQAERLASDAKQRGFLLGRWYAETIDPKGVVKEKVGYHPGDCPQAEQTAKEVLNLPCSPRTSRADVNRLCQFIKENVSSH